MEREKHLFIGTYTEPIKFGTGEILYGRGKGIYILKFDPVTGYIRNFAVEEGIVNPSYVVFSNSGKYLYAVNEVKEFDGEATGTVSAFEIDEAEGRLKFINMQKTGGTDPCHININKDDTHVFVSNFMSGSVCVLPVSDNGGLKEAVQLVQHEGSSVNLKRQSGPHAHSLIFDRDNSFAFVPDLGIDKLVVYKTDFTGGKPVMTPQREVEVSPGSGPRHCEFDSEYHRCYLINELASSISVFDYDGMGDFSLKQTVSTLNEPFDGDNTCADIHIAPDGRYLYASNRGHNSIVVYSVDEMTGSLTYVSSVGCGGKTPRSFAVDPSGGFLVVANQDSGNIVSFAIDQKDGTLSEVMNLDSPTPVCVKFF